jgi:NADPH:quinone reductase-like Zn-dependent oxidoreductase
MKAIVLQRSTDSNIELVALPKPLCQPNEVLIRIKAAALNHRDEWCRMGLYPNIKDGIVLGSDAAGIVEEVGSAVDSALIGQEIMLNPALHWGDNEKAQGKNFEIIGMPRNGTFAEYVAVPADRVFLKPSHLSWEEAAALTLAGLTAYRAVFSRGGLKAHERILINEYRWRKASSSSRISSAPLYSMLTTAKSVLRTENL